MAFCIGSIQNAISHSPIQNESIFYRTGGNPTKNYLYDHCNHNSFYKKISITITNTITLFLKNSIAITITITIKQKYRITITITNTENICN